MSTLNIREKVCPLCGSTLYLTNGTKTGVDIVFTLKCVGQDCNFEKKVIRKFTERKEDHAPIRQE
jgi:hypothetical protein